MLKVLIVEDEPLMRNYLFNNLTVIHSSFEVVACARDGVEAVEIIISGTQIDLVLTDIKMPRMDGLELASYIHNDFPKIPVIILTGYSEFEFARDALKSGAVDYLLKPLNDNELHHNLQLIAERNRQEIQQTHELQNNPNIDENLRDMDSTKALIIRATEYIKNNFQFQLSLSQVANKLGVSPAYLSNVFHIEVGETYSQYILRLRMERASQLLLTYSAAKVYNIAHEVGYISPKHFNSAFKKYFGKTPNEFRHGQSQCPQ